MALFATIGMFVLDDIEWPELENKKIIGYPGGAGTFALAAAALMTPLAARSGVAMIVDCGDDFPVDVRNSLSSWGTGIKWRTRKGEHTTRGLNTYGPGEFRDFRYLAPKLQITANDILSYPDIAQAKAIHFICQADRCIRETSLLQESWRTMVWEPVLPDRSTGDVAQELAYTLEACKFVTCYSPNTSELSWLLQSKEPNTKVGVEALAHRFSLLVPAGAMRLLVVRAGAIGSYGLMIRSGIDGINDDCKSFWAPAYHQDSKAVVDPTGAGNGFAGALAIALAKSPGLNSLEDVLSEASVAASFMIEQYGLPQYDPDTQSWNNDTFIARKQRYLDAQCSTKTR